MQNLRVLSVAVAFAVMTFALQTVAPAGLFFESRPEFFAARPQDRSFTTSEGKTYALPLHFGKYQSIILAGLIDLEKAKQMLAPSGLYPVPVTKTQGIAFIMNVDYQQSSINLYQEITFMVYSSTRPLSVEDARDRVDGIHGLAAAYFPWLKQVYPGAGDTVGLLMDKIALNDHDGIVLGREAWGLPKEFAQISMRVRKESAWLDASGDYSLHLGREAKITDIALPTYMGSTIFTIHNGGLKRTFSEAMTRSVTALFNPHEDQFYSAPDSKLGRALNGYGFKPVSWQIVHDCYGAFDSKAK